MKRTTFQPNIPQVPYMGPISNQQTQNNINQEKYKTLYSKFQISDYNELEKQDYENIDLSFKTDDGSIINAIISNDNLTESEIILLFKKFKNFSNLTPTTTNVNSSLSPLHIACQKQYYTVIKYLIDNGFNRSIEKQYDSLGNLPIHYLFQNLTYDCKENDYYQSKNFISNKKNKYKQKEIDFEKLLISSIHNHCKNDVKYKNNLNKNFDELIKLNKFYNIDEFTSIINDTQDKIKQLLIKKKLFIKEPKNEGAEEAKGDEADKIKEEKEKIKKFIDENIEEISKDPEFIQILNEAQKNLSNKFDKYKINNIENIEETFNAELQQANSSNDKENFKANEAFNTNSNKLLKVGEQFRHNYFDDPLSLVFVYKYIYETIDTNLVDMLDNKTGDNQLNVITILSDINPNNFENKEYLNFFELIVYLYHHINFLKLYDDLDYKVKTVPPGKTPSDLENLIINNKDTTLDTKDMKSYNNSGNLITLMNDIKIIIELLKYLKKYYSYIFKKINYDFMMNYLRINHYLRRDTDKRKFEDNPSYNKYKKLFENYQQIKENIEEAFKNFEGSDKNENYLKEINSNYIYNDYNLKNDNNDNKNKKEKREKLKYYQEKPGYYLNTKGDISFQHFININVPNNYNVINKNILNSNENKDKQYDNINNNIFIYFIYNQLNKKRNKFGETNFNNFKFKFTSGYDIYKKILKLNEIINYLLDSIINDTDNKCSKININKLIGFNVSYSLEIYYEIIDIIILLIKEYKNFIKYSDNKVINKINDSFLDIKKDIKSSFTNYDKLIEEQTKYVNNLLNNYEINALKKNYEQIYDYCIKQIEKIDNIIQKYNKSISFKFLNNINDDKDITDDFSINKFQSLKNPNVFNDEKFFDAIYSKYKDNTDKFINDTYIILNDINYNIIHTKENYSNIYDKNKNFYTGINLSNTDDTIKINSNINIKKQQIKNNIYKSYNIKENKIGFYIKDTNNYKIKDRETYNFPIISIEYIKLILMFLIKDKIPDLNEIKESYEEKTKEEKYAKYAKYKHFINDENLLKSLVVYYNCILNKLQFKETSTIIKDYILTDEYEELKTKYELLKDDKYEDLIKENPIRFDLLSNETDKVNDSRLINDKCYNSNTLIENSDILKQLNILDLTKQGHNIMNILIDQMNFKAISYIIDNESSLTHNGNYIKTMKDKNNLTPCEYARNKLNIIIGQYSLYGEEFNSLLSFQSKTIDKINSEDKFNIGLQKDDTIKNIIMNCFYLFNEFIWLYTKNDKIKNLFEIVDTPLIKTLNEVQIFQSNIFEEPVKEKLMDDYKNKYKTEIDNFVNDNNNYKNYEDLINEIKQDYIKIIKIVNANDVKSYSRINNLIFDNFETKISSNLVDLNNYFNNINEKVCQTYYDLDKTVNDEYNQTNMNIIEIIRLNIINIYVFEFNEIIKVYLKRINGVDYEINNSEILKNIFYYVIVMELKLSGDEILESYEIMKEQFIIKVFNENGIETDEIFNTFINSSMDFYKTIIVLLSKYFNERVINYISNLQSISILLNIIEKLK